jgi:hypothetical protein
MGRSTRLCSQREKALVIETGRSIATRQAVTRLTPRMEPFGAVRREYGYQDGATLSMAGLSELDDNALLHEYRQSIKRLLSLDPALPKPMHEIRAKYRDYLADELAKRGLLSTKK